jgi:hypothetical protein
VGNCACHSLGYKWEGSHRFLSGTPVQVATLWDHLEYLKRYPADIVITVIVNIVITV